MYASYLKLCVLCSYLLSTNQLAAAPLLADIKTEDTSPQLEVVRERPVHRKKMEKAECQNLSSQLRS
jgi:hypothetical protein